MTSPRPSPLVRFYLWQGSRWSKLIRVIEGVQTGIWLGLLSHRQLQAIDELHYARNATYNGEEHNLGGLMPWEEAAADGYFRNRKRLALIGAGAGREVLALERRGHDVTGFECNRTLVAFAGDFLPRHGATATVHFLERDAAPPAAEYDGVILGWSAYTLIHGRERRIDLLRRLRPLLPEGAPLQLSFLTRLDAVTRLKASYQVARFLRKLLGREPAELGDDLMPLFVHRFTREEIAAEMAAAGFELARYEPEGRGPRDSGWAVGHAR